MYFIYFTDSLHVRHQLFYQPHSYPNLMQLVRDGGYEDWGDCRGRAWCATCHIKILMNKRLPLSDRVEKNRLDQLSNLTNHSRLACQISLNEEIHQLEIFYIGDD